MINKFECSKKFKKICDRTVSITKKEIRTAKNYSQLWTHYSLIKDSINENTRRLNSVKLMLQKKTQNVEALRQLDKERQKKLVQLREEIKTLEEKIKVCQDNGSQDSERNKAFQLQLLRLFVLKTCTKTHINDTKPNTIRGFTANEQLLKTIAFEIDSGRLTKSEIQNAVWENCYKCSGYENDWDHLFAADSNAAITLVTKDSVVT